MRKKRNIEKQNDILTFLDYFGPAVYYVVFAILVTGLLIAFFTIRGAISRHSEQVSTKQQQELIDKRQEIVDNYISKNPDKFGTVSKQWNNGSLFFIESEYGEFTIAFDELVVSKVLFENKAGQIMTLYEKE